MSYLATKYLHTVVALLTISGFVLRGFWMVRESPLLEHRLTRIAPHVIDTVLLVSGVTMLAMLSLNPLTEAWLVAKFAGLLLYILLGTLAIRRGPTKETRIVALVAAVAVFAWVIGVALAKAPASWLALMT